LLRIAPHLVKPLPLLLPVYESNRRGPFLIRAGMVAYDLLSIDKTLEHHHFLSREQALARTPGLQPVGLRAAALYFDAQVEFPERLTLENVISAADYGAEVRTYTRVERVMADGGAVRGVELSDVISGERSLAYAPVVFNVAGPWVDELAASSDQSAARLIGGTKGSHIVVAPFHGAPVTALYVEAEKDRRPLFIIPWNNLYLIGTTDERFDDDPDCAVATNAEVEYLIRETNRIIPDARLSFDSVLYSYAGVRPLPFTEAGDPRGITRRHFIRKAELNGFYSVIGGKLTTYRSLAEEAVDIIFQALDRQSPRCETANRPLPGAAVSAVSEFGLREANLSEAVTPITTQHLYRVYGGRAHAIIELIINDHDLAVPLDEQSGTIAAEVVFAFRYEFARTLTDFMMRRSMLGLSGGDVESSALKAADVAVRHLGWSSEKAAGELSALSDYLQRFRISRVADPGRCGHGELPGLAKDHPLRR
jgi:glycerol-3-phosphate dehydrogenase